MNRWQGWNYLKSRMKENPVFLVIDNVQPDDVSKAEVLEYLNVEYSSQRQNHGRIKELRL